MELSKQKQTEAKKLNVTVQYLVFADLCAVGYSEADAYIIAYPENAALSVRQNDSIRKNIVESAKFKKLLEDRLSRVKDGIATPVLLDDVEFKKVWIPIGFEPQRKSIILPTPDAFIF